MGKFYIVRDCYAPDTAPANRLLGFINAFSERGIKMDVVFFMPNSNRSIAEPNPNIRFHYYWKYLPFTQNWLRFPLYLFVYKYLFTLRVRKGDTVLLVGNNCNNLVPLLTLKKGVRVFNEVVEHPEVVRLKFTNPSRYYKYVPKLDGLFAISTPIRDFFVSKGLAREKAHVINMTVDPARFDGLRKESVPDYIAYCGTASNNKDGVDELIKAFAIVHKTHPQVKLYIIGATPSKTDAEGNQKLISDLGIQDYVFFTGRISAQKMPQILKNAIVLALDRPKNKQAEYGFPTKLGEYLLTKNPVVVTNVGTISDFLEDGVSALIAEDSNPIDFASKICWALDHPKEAALIGKNGCEVALNCFNATIEGAKMLDIMFSHQI